MNKIITWIFIFCSLAILYVGSDFLAPVLSGLILAFGLRPLEDSFLFKRIPTSRGRSLALLVGFLMIFSTLGTYVIVASAKNIARNVDLSSIQGKTPEEIKQEPMETQAESLELEPKAEDPAYQNSGIIDQAKELINKIPGMNADEIAKIWAEIIARAKTIALTILSKILTAGPTLFIQWVIFLLSFVVFFLNYNVLTRLLLSFDKKAKHVKECVTFFKNATRATLMGTLVVGTAQASIITIGTAIAGFESYVLLGLCAFFASFIPFVGTSLVWVSALIYALLHGDSQAAIIVSVAGALSSVADNLILPTFIGSKNKVHPLLLFIVVIGFIELIGIWGLFIGPVLAIFSTRVFELWIKEVT
jgi:predicted PurR-regulated permease PerM